MRLVNWVFHLSTARDNKNDYNEFWCTVGEVESLYSRVLFVSYALALSSLFHVPALRHVALYVLKSHTYVCVFRTVGELFAKSVLHEHVEIKQ